MSAETPTAVLRRAASDLRGDTTDPLARPLADWLDSTAATVDAVTRKYADAAPADAHWLAPALAVARAVLGEDAPTAPSDVEPRQDAQ